MQMRICPTFLRCTRWQQVAAQHALVLTAFEKDIRLAAADAGGATPKPGGFTAAAAKCRAGALDAFAAAYTKHLRIPGRQQPPG